MKPSIVALVSVLALSVAHAPAAVAGEGKAALKEADAALNAASGPAAMAAFYADDVRFLGVSSGLITGKQAVQAHLEKMGKLPGIHSEAAGEAADVSAAGDYGFTIGSVKVALTVDGGKTLVMPGKYLRVWKTYNGAWKVAAVSLNSIPGAEEMQ